MFSEWKNWSQWQEEPPLSLSEGSFLSALWNDALPGVALIQWLLITLVISMKRVCIRCPSERWPWWSNCCGIASRADQCQKLESKERTIKQRGKGAVILVVYWKTRGAKWLKVFCNGWQGIQPCKKVFSSRAEFKSKRWSLWSTATDYLSTVPVW